MLLRYNLGTCRLGEVTSISKHFDLISEKAVKLKILCQYKIKCEQITDPGI